MDTRRTRSKNQQLSQHRCEVSELSLPTNWGLIPVSWHSGLRAGSSISVLRRNQLAGTGSCFRDRDGGVATSSCLTLSAGVALVVQFGFPLAPGDD